MVRMIPPVISDDVKSDGERRIFDLFKNCGNATGWEVMHSLILKKHVTKLLGEIDFVVLAPRLGIFCLEVKSGDVHTASGLWRYTNRYGQVEENKKNPVHQARDNMYSFQDLLYEESGHDRRVKKLVMNFGLIFPDMEYDLGYFEIDRRQILDKKQMESCSIVDYVERLSGHAVEKLERQRPEWYHPRDSLPTFQDVARISHICRPSLERPQPFVIIGIPDPPLDRISTIADPGPVQPGETAERAAILASKVEEQLKTYTVEQFACLDVLEENPRCLFKGAAGTGKTMIALESARRSLARGERVLFMCYNKILGKWLRLQLEQTTGVADGQLLAGHFHGFLASLPGMAKMVSMPSGGDAVYFNKTLPEEALKRIVELQLTPFDKIIIDEGQDLISEENLNVFNPLLKGGLATGQWEIYCDFQRQAIFTGQTAQKMEGMLRERAPDLATGKLSINCRNTEPIAANVSRLSGFEQPPCRPGKVGGLPVSYLYYGSALEEAQKLEEHLEYLQGQGVAPGCISVISTHVIGRSGLASGRDQLPRLKEMIFPTTEEFEVEMQQRKTVFYTIHSYKGMENQFIVVADVESLAEEKRKLLYVGMSRARVGLTVLAHENLRSEIEKLVSG